MIRGLAGINEVIVDTLAEDCLDVLRAFKDPETQQLLPALE